MAEAADEAQIRAGLTQLAAHIAADVPTSARWVQVETEGQRSGIFGDHQGDPFRIEGNALLISEKKEVEARIVSVNSATAATIKHISQAEKMTPQDYQRGQMPATWKDADLAKDVAAALEWLGKEVAKKGGSTSNNDPFGGSSGEGGPPQARALIWAALLMHTGHAEEAVKMAAIVLKDADEETLKEVLDASFEHVASMRYMRCLMDFATHRQWSRLRDELTALISHFPHGWRQRDATRVFLKHVTARAAFTSEPPFKTTPALPEAEQKVLSTWVTELESGKQPPYSRWVLPPLEGQRQMDGEQTTAFPASHGLKALPMLAALLTDETLTTSMNAYGGGSFFGASGSDAAEKLRSAYSQLMKPSTRAELAWSTLQRVLPSELQHSDLSFADRSAEVLSWYAKIKDLPPAELALSYLESGDNDELVLAHALRLEDPKKFQRLEKTVIENAQVYSLNNLSPFVTKLGPEKAPAFLTQLRTKLEADLSRYGSGDNEQQKMLERGMKKLEAAAKSEGGKIDINAALQTLMALTDDAEGEAQMDAQDAYQQLTEGVKKMPQLERLTLLLPRIPEFKSGRFAGALIQIAQNNGDEAPTPLTQEQRKTLLSTLKPSWNPFLEKQRSQEITQQQLSLLSPMAYCLGTITGKPLDERLFYKLASFGNRVVPVYDAWIDAVLNEKEPPAWPDASTVPEAERAQLITTLGNKTQAEMREVIAKLSLPQLMALSEYLQRPDELPASWKSYLGAIQTIECADSAEAALWQGWLGKAWGHETILGLTQQAAKSESGKVLVLHLMRPTLIFGWKLSIVPQAKLTDWTRGSFHDLRQGLGDSMPKLAKRIVSGQFSNGRSHANWTTFDTPVTDIAKAPALPTDDELQAAAELMKHKREEESQAWKTIQDSFSNEDPSPARGNVMIRLISVSPADIIAK